MTDPIARPPAGPGSSTAAGATDDGRLRKAARQLEGVFTQQLFKAMRETVPEDQGVVGGSSAQEMFTGLLDEHLASDPRAASTHGIGEAIYHHLLRARGTAAAPAAAPGVTPPTGGASLRKSPERTTP
ncbi:hypothetical protein tb265_17410 [Gemmatimonadetes bacterium T265]|nr:hypothetical protein tb265_17410 [Gemmatimonadetes bacterium T265]